MAVLKKTIDIHALAAEVIRQRDQEEYDSWSLRLFPPNRRFVELRGWKHHQNPNKGRKLGRTLIRRVPASGAIHE